MADKKISGLDPTTTIGDADLLTTVQSGANKKITGANVKSEIGWERSGTDVTPKNAGDNVNIGTGGLKDDDVTTPVNLGDASNTSLDTTNKTIIGSSNELKGRIDVLETDESNIYYAGKHGNDSNSGLNIEEAFLTFGAAITAAAAQTPSTTNRFAIVCFDAGIYTENITTQSWININAPNAKLEGNIVLVDNVRIYFNTLENSTGVAVLKSSGTTLSIIKLENLIVGGAVGVLNASATSQLYIEIASTRINSVGGIGIGDVTTSTGHMHVLCQDIYLAGNNATAIAYAGSGLIVGQIDHILETGAPTGTTGINALGGVMNVNVNELIADTAYSVGATAQLSLFVNSIQGIETVAGGGIRNVFNLSGASNISNALNTSAAINSTNDIITDSIVTASELNLYDTDLSNILSIIWNEDDTSDRALDLYVNGSSRALHLEGDTYISQDYRTSASPAFTGATLSGLNTANGIVRTDGSGVLSSSTSLDVDNITLTNIETDNFKTGVIDTDGTLTADSDTRLATQKAIKTYVDNKVAGLSWRPAVDLKDDVETDAGANIVGQTSYNADGIAIVNGDRLLLTAETTAPGTYLDRVFLVAGVGSSITLTLETDGQAGDGSPTDGDSLFVQRGNTNADKSFTYDGTDFVLGAALNGALVATNNLSDVSNSVASFDNISPVTTLGDIIYRDASNNARLAGNTTTTKKFLSQIGTGAVSAAPVWDDVAASDIVAGALNIGANAFTVNSIEIVGADGEVNAAAIEDVFLRNDGDDSTTGTLTVKNALIDGGTNTFSITNGTASLDIAAGATLDVDANLSVESASAINQDLTTDASPTFVGVVLTGDIDVRGGDIQNTIGALTITPNAGSGLNITLSTTGDFAINTDDVFFDTSAGRFGLGTNAPVARLDVLFGNTDTESGTDSYGFKLRQSSTGDVLGAWVADGQTYYMGIDNSDSNIFKMAATTGTPSFATDTFMAITSDGHVTKPLSAAFLAYLSVSTGTVTGDDTVYTIAFDSEVYDRNNDFASNTFTAPVTGLYNFSGTFYLTSLDSSHTSVVATLVTSNGSYILGIENGANVADVSTNYADSFSIDVDMDAADTATLTIEVRNGGKDVIVVGGAGNTVWSGRLVG